MLLTIKNQHERDKDIIFKEEGHVYILKKYKKPVSVTTFIHNNFPKFNADKVLKKMRKSALESKILKEEWDKNGKKAAKLGTLMHADIERYLNEEKVLKPNNIEFKFFLNFWNDFKEINGCYIPYRTEWVVYDEEYNLAGSIDCILKDNKNNMIILDWKRSKEIKKFNVWERGFYPFDDLDNCNFNHYTLQLNIYKYILEKNYGCSIKKMFIVVFHPNNENYELFEIDKYNIQEKLKLKFKK